MTLPHLDQAIIDITKLTDYCLSQKHVRGRHKARVFFGALGFTAAHAEALREQLLKALPSAEALCAGEDDDGSRYEVYLSIRGPAGVATVKNGVDPTT